MSPLKCLLVDAIIGRGVGGDMAFADNMTKQGYAEFTGNQWNEDWGWKRSALETLDLDELDGLYAQLLAI